MERVAQRLSHGFEILLISVIVNRVVAVTNSIGSSVCGLLGLLCCITETGREPSATSRARWSHHECGTHWVTTSRPKKQSTNRYLGYGNVKRLLVATLDTTACAAFKNSSLSHRSGQRESTIFLIAAAHLGRQPTPKHASERT